MVAETTKKSDGGTTPMVENRRTERYPVFKHARILGVGDSADMICVIQNISVYGAELKVGLSQRVPNEFSMHIRVDQRTYRCRKIWREGTRFGVEFIDG